MDKENDLRRARLMHTLFSGFFNLQNRLLNAEAKISDDISIKQWLLLAEVEDADSPRSLTELGRLLGCSRQNVKKLAAELEKKGYVRIARGDGNSVVVEATEKVEDYKDSVKERQVESLEVLFSDFSDEEVEQFYELCRKLDAGIRRLEG